MFQIAVTRKDGFSLSAREFAALLTALLPGEGEGGFEEVVFHSSNGLDTVNYESLVVFLSFQCLSELYSIGEGPPRPELQFAVGEVRDLTLSAFYIIVF